MLKNLMSLLLSLFYSKKESADVGHQAMMSSESVTLLSEKSIESWGTVATGIASFDGYLFLRGNSNSSDIGSLNIKTTVAFVPLLYPYEYAGSSAILPVTKGTTWTVEGSHSNKISLFLKKTIGEITGGGLSFIQGGAICLNNLLRSLRKHSLEIKNRGFRLLIRLTGMGMSRLTFNPCRITSLTIISKGMYRLLMALLSMQMPENPSIFVYKLKDFSLCTLADTTLWLFESTKEKQYFYKRKILKIFVDSYRLERTNKVILGGASC